MSTKNEDEVLDESAALTGKEELFCQAFGNPESETYGMKLKSAAKAGYAEPGAHTAAWKLLRRPRIKARLQEIYVSGDFSVGKVMSNLANDRIRALAKDDIATACRCDELMGKRLRLFVDSFQDVGGVLTDEEKQVDAERKAMAEEAGRLYMEHKIHPGGNVPHFPTKPDENADGNQGNRKVG